MNFDLTSLVRKNIMEMKPYSSARHEFEGEAEIFLDANESPYQEGSDLLLNRYPDPLQKKLKEKLSLVKGIPADHVFTGNGSDEAIDLLFRIFCEPGKSNVIIMPPTYGMYEVCADINNVAVRKVNLDIDFNIDIDEIQNAIDIDTRLIFICTPNNPSGNYIKTEDVDSLLLNFKGLVVVDEAYINFSRQRSFIHKLPEHPNLIVLQTLSKAWGLAGLRIGMAFASRDVIGLMNKVKYPYNINVVSQDIALEALDQVEVVNERIKEIVGERERISQALKEFSFVKFVFPSDANFLLVRVDDAKKLYAYLASKKIVVRDRSNQPHCEQCLRITIGTPGENDQLLNALKKYS